MGIDELEEKARQLRINVIKMNCNAESGHTAGPLGLADIYAALYFKVLNHRPKEPEWDGRDRLILSNGHVCPIRYSAMAESGYFPREELMTFRKIDSRLQGHPSRLDLPGLETSNASLGQGLSLAIGIALGLRMDKNKARVYACLSDGELQEGSSWEAAMFAAKFKTDNLTAFVDRNYIQIDGPMDEIMPSLDPLAKKWRAFGWEVLEGSGHDMKKIVELFEKAAKVKGKPCVIIFRTIPGKGVSFMEGDYKWHGTPPKPEEAVKAFLELKAAKEDIEWAKARIKPK